MKNLVFAVVALVLSYGAIAGASGENCPVSANVRGHENIEWSCVARVGLV